MTIIALKVDVSRIVSGTYKSNPPYILLIIFLCLPETILYQMWLLITALLKMISISR